MRGGPRVFPQGFTCPVVLWILPRWPRLRLRGSHPLWPAFPGPFGWLLQSLAQSEPRRARTPVWAPPVPLAATPGITVVFSSSGYLDVSVRRVPSSMPMCSAWGGGVFPRRVSPFRHLRIDGHLLLPAAFRSLSRLSSAPGAKASALCPSLLNRPHSRASSRPLPSVAGCGLLPGPLGLATLDSGCPRTCMRCSRTSRCRAFRHSYPRCHVLPSEGMVHGR